MGKSVSECDKNADTAIKTMIAACVGGAVVPAHINWTIVAGAMGTGVVAIGLCYEVKLDKDEAWKLIKQFFLAAGTMFLMVNVGSKIISIILASTGIGYVGAVALDAAISAAQAYAVGACAKEYFRRDFLGKGKPSKKELGKIFREAFKQKKAEVEAEKD